MRFQDVDTNVLISKGLIEDYRNFKIQIRNRREKIEEGERGFKPAYKCELFKLNQEGDPLNPEHWLRREMWIAKNGAFCYYSKKEERELQYYKSEDTRYVQCQILEADATCQDFAFSLTLPACDGLEYAPGVFSATNEQDMVNFIHTIKKFQKIKERQSQKKAEKAAAAAAES